MKLYILDYGQGNKIQVELYNEDLQKISEFSYDPYDPFILENSGLFNEVESHIEQTSICDGDYELFYYDEHPKNQDPTI